MNEGIMNKLFSFMLLFMSMQILIIPTIVEAEKIAGVEFPDGNASFADEVFSFEVGTWATSPYINPSLALGTPENNGNVGGSSVSLGNGGTLIVKFSDNSLTTSGDSKLDLWIFEIGPGVEKMDVFISTNLKNWISVGFVEGSTSGVDIDAYISNGVVVGQRYQYVKLVDDIDDDASQDPWAGADVDAIGAISSSPPMTSTCFDSDGDGVIDDWDKCPDTAIGSWINSVGCPAQGLYTEEQMNQMVSTILLWGDINGDSKISLIEAIKALRVSSGVIEPAIKNVQ